jgi:aspartate aminotransferase-like enzyme
VKGIEREVQAAEDIRWLWAVHCETSTGVLNDLPPLRSLCAARDLKLCLDAISSLGVAPVDLRGVHLASGVSGKGLAAYPGLSMVFHREKIAPVATLPRYLDLGFGAVHAGIPFTSSSNLLYAMRAALQQSGSTESFLPELSTLAAWLRGELRRAGFQIVAEDVHAAPALITLALPEHCDSRTVGEQLEQEGLWLSYRSAYLLERNWIQICLMANARARKPPPC